MANRITEIHYGEQRQGPWDVGVPRGEEFRAGGIGENTGFYSKP